MSRDRSFSGPGARTAWRSKVDVQDVVLGDELLYESLAVLGRQVDVQNWNAWLVPVPPPVDADAVDASVTE